MLNMKGNILNSKTERLQPTIVRTTIHTGGAELAGGRIISYSQDGSQITQRTGISTPPSPVDGGPGFREAPRRSKRRRNGQ